MNRERSKELLTNLIEVIKTEYTGLKDEDYYLLADMGIRAYNQDFDNDIDTEGQDFSFAFSGYLDIVKGALEIDENTIKDNNEIQHSISNNLLANIRTVTFEEYLQNNLIDKDRELYELLTMEKKVSNDDLDEELKRMILNDTLCANQIREFKKAVKNVYTCLLQDGFGLHPYEGILILDKADKFSLSINKEPQFRAIKNSSQALKPIVEIMSRQLNIQTTYKRQFDIKEIIGVTSKNNNENGEDIYTISELTDNADSYYRPFYYPYKIAEYAGGYKPTEDLDKPNYKKFQVEGDESRAISFEDIKEKNGEIKGYYSLHIEPQFYDYVLKAISYTLKSFPKDKWFTVTTQPYIVRSVQRLQKTVCTAVILTQYHMLNNDVTKLAVRVVESNGSIQLNCTEEMFSELTTNKMINYSDGLIISDLYNSAEPLAYRVIEFSHDFDAMLSSAKPLFGYKAIELYNKKGMSLSWDKILVGEDLKGTPVFMGTSDMQYLPLQQQSVHYVIAGSRSGKGVTTMNMLASAIASNKAIFYLDRKPDMATLFYGLSEGNMFIVNGGSRDKLDEDFVGYFDPDTGSAISGWKEAYDILPQYIKEIFPIKDYYGDGNIGDFVYFRAVIFTLGIIMARSNYEDDLGGSEGIVAIFDEFNNFQKAEDIWFNVVNGSFTQNYINEYDKGVITKIQTDIKMKKAKLSIVANDPKKVAEVIKLEAELDVLNDKLNQYLNNTKLYCTQVIDKLAESSSTLDRLVNAGYKNTGQVMKNDIFIIGQALGRDIFDDSTHMYVPKASSSGFEVSGMKKISLLASMIAKMPGSDFFMGRNTERKSYAGQNEGKANEILLERGLWGYSKSTNITDVTTTTPSDMKYFKTYLVLNNHKEPNPTLAKNEPDTIFVNQCIDRVNTDSGDDEMWEKVRLEHLPSKYAEEAMRIENPIKHYGELNRGIGFAGLIECMKQTPNVDFPTELRKSYDIANKVATYMGYNNYRELLYDFSVDGIFSIEDILQAIAMKDAVQYKKYHREKGLKTLKNWGFFNDADSSTDEESADFESKVIEETEEEDFESDVISSDNTNMNTDSQNFDTPVMRNTDLSGEVDDDIFDRDDEDYSQPVQSQSQTANQLSTEDISAIYSYVITKINQLMREERRFLTDEEFIALKDKWFNVIMSQLKGGIN